jgi:hypothetical protein
VSARLQGTDWTAQWHDSYAELERRKIDGRIAKVERRVQAEAWDRAEMMALMQSPPGPESRLAECGGWAWFADAWEIWP